MKSRIDAARSMQKTTEDQYASNDRPEEASLRSDYAEMFGHAKAAQQKAIALKDKGLRRIFRRHWSRYRVEDGVMYDTPDGLDSNSEAGDDVQGSVDSKAREEWGPWY